MMLLLLVLPARAADLDTLDLATGWMTGRGALQIDRPRGGDPGELGAGVVVAFETLPEERTAWWGSGLGLNLGASYVPVPGVGVDVAIAAYPWLSRADGDTGAALGDLRIGGTAELELDDERFGLALRPTLRIPTGTAKWGLGDGDLGAGFDVLGEFAPDEDWFFDGTVGVKAARSAVIGDEVVGSAARVGAGVGRRVIESIHAGAELTLEVPITLASKSDFEVHLWGQWVHTSGIGATIGAGTGLLEAAGAPTVRVLAGISYTRPGTPPVYDRDGDGLDDPNDRCPDAAEDLDTYKDDDGCPDLDNDEDGIPDAVDRCPREAEDRDGFEDTDGCVENDNDKDGVSDMIDDCRDVVGSVRAGGCPDKDDDRVADAFDDCPEVQGTEAGRGCPEVAEDTRPAEVKSEPIPNVIEVADHITFETGTATLTAHAETVLAGVARTLVAHAEIQRVRVEGHTDSDGGDEANMKLSQARAEAVVDWLVAHGVARSRLEAKGYGETLPVDTNATRSGRATNRRVEFKILDAR